MSFLLNIDTYFIPVINIKNSYSNTLVENWERIIFPSSSILFPTHKEYKVFYFNIIYYRKDKKPSKYFR